MSGRAFGASCLAIVAIALAVSAIDPFDRFTWFLEIAPILIGAAILVPKFDRWRPTRLLIVLLTIHSLILILGGAYTYARVPLGFWVQDAFGLARNHYDRLGHFAQGFIPAILAREILLRNTPLQRGGWLFVLVSSVCLAFSACYEFIEWWTALASGEAATDFLGTQGDPWDTQWDMFLALCGSIVAQLTLGKLHDRQLEKSTPPA